jgi:hypothetical protein
VLSKEMHKATSFFKRQSQLVCGAAAVCVDTAKRNHLLSNAEKANLRTAFRQIYYSLDQLQHFADLNVIAVAKFLKKFDKNTLQQSLEVFRDPLEELPFSGVFHGKRSIQLLKDDLFHCYAEYIAGSTKAANEALYLKDQAEKLRESQPVVLSTGLIAGICLSLIVFLILDFSQFDFPLWLPELKDAEFLLGVSLIFLLLPILWGLNVMVWESNAVNYTFVFDLDPTRPWTAVSILRSNAVYFLIWLAFTYATIRTALEDHRCGGSRSLVPSWVWPYCIVPACLLVKLFYVLLNAWRGKEHWLLRHFKRLLLTPLYSVEFSDFFLADQLTSLAGALSQLQFFWCYLRIEETSGVCAAGIGQGVVSIALLPSLWRLVQCLQRYFEQDRADRKLFPHIFNALKYCTNLGAILSGFALSMVSYHEGAETTAGKVATGFFLGLSALSFFANCVWDAIMDAGIIQVSWLANRSPSTPSSVTSDGGSLAESAKTQQNGDLDLTSQQAEDLSLSDDGDGGRTTTSGSSFNIGKGQLTLSIRQTILYPSMAYYYMFLVLDPLMRLTWLGSFLVARYMDYPSWRFFVFAAIDILRRWMWNFFRVEHEQLHNYENYRATKFVPVPARSREIEVETAEDILNRFKAQATDHAAARHGLAVTEWSALSRLFADLPEGEKVSILHSIDDETAERFLGVQFEGKSKYFASLPEPLKAHLLIKHIGPLTLADFKRSVERQRRSSLVPVFESTQVDPPAATAQLRGAPSNSDSAGKRRGSSLSGTGLMIEVEMSSVVPNGEDGAALQVSDNTAAADHAIFTRLQQRKRFLDRSES